MQIFPRLQLVMLRYHQPRPFEDSLVLFLHFSKKYGRISASVAKSRIMGNLSVDNFVIIDYKSIYGFYFTVIGSIIETYFYFMTSFLNECSLK
jgi:hypothetical protein